MCVFMGSVIIGDFYVLCVVSDPAETNAVFVVNSDTVLPCPLAFEGFEAVSGR